MTLSLSRPHSFGVRSDAATSQFPTDFPLEAWPDGTSVATTSGCSQLLKCVLRRTAANSLPPTPLRSPCAVSRTAQDSDLSELLTYPPICVHRHHTYRHHHPLRSQKIVFVVWRRFPMRLRFWATDHRVTSESVSDVRAALLPSHDDKNLV